MEPTKQEQQVLEALKKVPKKGESRLSISFQNGKIKSIDLTTIETIKLS